MRFSLVETCSTVIAIIAILAVLLLPALTPQPANVPSASAASTTSSRSDSAFHSFANDHAGNFSHGRADERRAGSKEFVANGLSSSTAPFLFLLPPFPITRGGKLVRPKHSPLSDGT